MTIRGPVADLIRAERAVLRAAKRWHRAVKALDEAFERDMPVSAGAPVSLAHLDADAKLRAAVRDLRRAESAALREAKS